MCNGVAKQVSDSVEPYNMVGFMKQFFELLLRDEFHEKER